MRIFIDFTLLVRVSFALTRGSFAGNSNFVALADISQGKTTAATDPGYAWFVGFEFGNVFDISKGNINYVQAVRTGS
jgi:hypothetical protein